MSGSLFKERHAERKERVLALLNEVRDYFADHKDAERANVFESLAADLRGGQFSVVVVGEFSAGKSTFLNALMGDVYLPSYKSETTATINFLRHREHSPGGESAVIYFTDPERQPLSAEATPDMVQRYVSTRSDIQVVKDIDRVELFLDSRFLEDGVMLVDSPGLNGVAEGHRELTEHQIEKSHACIFMFSAEQPGRKTDFEFLAELQSKVDTVFLVLNKIDEINPHEQSVDDVIRTLKSNYRLFFPDAKVPEILPIAAYPALIARSGKPLSYRGKEEHSEEERGRYEAQSGIERFEDRLWRFLAQGEKTRQELLAPADRVLKLLLLHRQEIERMKNDLGGAIDGDELASEMERLETEIAQLAQSIEDQKAELYEAISRIVKELREQLQGSTQQFRRKLSGEVEGWTDLDNLQQDIGLFNQKINKQYRQLVAGIGERFMEDFSELLQSRYRAARQQIEASLGEQQAAAGEAQSFEFDGSAFSFHFGLDDYQRRKSEYEQEIEALEHRIDETANQRLQAELLLHEKEALEERLRNIDQRELTHLSVFGPRPGVDRHEKEERERKWRGGVGGWIANLFAGRKEVVTRQSYADDSAQRLYDERQAKIESKYAEEQRKLQEQLDGLKLDASEHPERQRQLQAQLERARLHKRDELNRYMDDYKVEFQRKHAAALRKVKQEIDDYLDSMEKEVEDRVLKQLRSQRRALSEIAADVIQSNIAQAMEQKRQQLERRKRQMEASVEEKTRLLQGYEDQLAAINALLQEAVSVTAELKTMEIDTIRMDDGMEAVTRED